MKSSALWSGRGEGKCFENRRSHLLVTGEFRLRESGGSDDDSCILRLQRKVDKFKVEVIVFSSNMLRAKESVESRLK